MGPLNFKSSTDKVSSNEVDIEKGTNDDSSHSKKNDDDSLTEEQYSRMRNLKYQFCSTTMSSPSSSPTQ